LQPGGHRFDPGQLHQKTPDAPLREQESRDSGEKRVAESSSRTFVSGFPVDVQVEFQLDVGRQCDNRFRITVQESRLAPNIGLDD
jgi:hypothetical protein